MPDTFVGARVKAADFPAGATNSDQTANDNITSTSYVAGTPEVGVVFVAPTSGQILVTVGAGFKDSAGNRVHVSPEIFAGSTSGGSQVLAPDVTIRGVGSVSAATANHYRSRTTLVTGILTPGSTYFARTVHKVSAGTTADIAERDITITPTPLGGDIAGSVIKALDFPPAVWASDTTQIDNPSNTAYATGSPVVSITFVAPTSGRVLLIVGGGLGNGAAADRVFLAPQVFQGVDATGTEILVPSVVTRGFSSENASAGFHYGSRETVLDGLTPGTTYFARVMHAVKTSDAGATTGDIAARQIIACPLP